MGRLMKDSGVPWLGLIPNDWAINTLGNFFIENTKVNSALESKNALKFKFGTIIQKPNDKEREDEDGLDILCRYTLVEPDDIIINGLNLNFDFKTLRVGIVRESGIITSAYIAIRPRLNAIYPDYFNYLLTSLDFQKVFHNMGAGLRQTLKYSELKTLIVLSLPIPEQQRIASFLDRKCKEVDELIELQEKMIEELKAYKQSVINEAVTKGLNSEVQMKDSGVEWIGQIPEHWDVNKVKYLLTKNDGGIWGEEPKNIDTDKIVIRSTEQTIDGYWDIQDPALRDLSACDYKSFLINKGDLLVTKSSGSSSHIGKTTIADDYFVDNECYYSNFIQRLRCNDKCLPYYMWYILNSILSREQFVFFQNSTSGIGNLNSTIINNIFIPKPPISEQEAIINYLNIQTKKINNLLAIKQVKIDTLQEYKKSIIYEYTTGKKEVPEK